MTLATRTRVKPPASLAASATASVATRVALAWPAAPETGGWPVACYNVYRDEGLLVESLTATSYIDTTVPARTSVSYGVAAINVNGVEGAPRSSAVVYVPALASLSASTSLAGTILGGTDFEDRAAGFSYAEGTSYALPFGGTCTGSYDQGTAPLVDVQGTIVTTPTYRGAKAMRWNIPSGTGAFRSEISWRAWGGIQGANFQGLEHFIGMALRLDAAFPVADGLSCVLFQQHNYTGQPGSSPIWGLRLTNALYRITTEVQGPGSGPNFTVINDAGNDRGQWRRWVFHVRYSTAANGWVRTYRDGVLLHDTGNFQTVPTGTTQLGFYKFGLYASGMATGGDTRTAVTDAVRGSSSAAGGSIALVDPGSY